MTTVRDYHEPTQRGVSCLRPSPQMLEGDSAPTPRGSRWLNVAFLLLMAGAPRQVAACPPMSLSETLAVNTHYGAPRGAVDRAALARLAEAGVGWIRNDLDWAAVEQVASTYDFATPGFDALIDAAESVGLHVLFVLDYGNPLYGPANAVVDDAGRRAFAAYAAAAAARYGGRGHAWEIWNEPNLPQFWNGPGTRPDPALYAQLVRAAAPAIRAADPSARVLIGSAFMAFPAVVAARTNWA